MDHSTQISGPEHSGNELLEAVRTYPFRFVAPIVVLVAAAILIGLLRPPTYTSEARLAVGRINVATTAAPGVVSASQSLASAYSRAISADQVSKQIDREVPDAASGSVSASPIPESPVILIEAEAESAGTAIELANAGSRALISYINELNSTVAENRELLATYRSAREEVDALLAEGESAGTGPELEAARLKVKALEQAYRGSVAENTSGNDLRVLTTASAASNNRSSVLELLVLAALVGGTAIGVGLAYAGVRP